MQRILSVETSRSSGPSSEFVSKKLCCSFLLTVAFFAVVGGVPNNCSIPNGVFTSLPVNIWHCRECRVAHWEPMDSIMPSLGYETGMTCSEEPCKCIADQCMCYSTNHNDQNQVPDPSDLYVRKVLVLYVGGTIGMERNSNGVYIPSPNKFLEKVKFHSQMHDSEIARKYVGDIEYNELVIPSKLRPSDDHNLVLYQLREYDPLLDSSNMSHKDWIRIAKDIEGNYKDFDGFVVLHGTDTLAYTASVLSFLLEGLQKPVILTGSQIPIFETRSDAKDNLLSSLIFAGCYDIPEVCILFSNKLFRGNRTAKISTSELDAFYSPNYHTLADVGIKIKVHKYYIRRNLELLRKPFKAFTNINPNVGLLMFFPTITAAMVKAFLKPPMQGVVIQSYGSGNIPTNQPELLEALKEAIQRGLVVVNITQCAQGAVSVSYEAGKMLEDIGIISGYDMTAEAALAKLCYVLGLPHLQRQDVVKKLQSDLRGELTPEESSSKLMK